MVWNRLTTRQLRKGQKLMVYLSLNPSPSTQVVKNVEALDISPEVTEDHFPVLQPVEYYNDITFSKFSKSKKWLKRDKKYVYHKIRRGESLYDVAEKYKVTVYDLLNINDIKATQVVKTGAKIKVKEK